MLIHIRILLLVSVLPFFLHAQVSRALVVTIGQYPETSGWAKIHGDNDREIVLRMLHSYGYVRQNITLLTNHQATRLAIRSAFEKLTRQTTPGDRVYIHFSCHGQQMVDDNGDEEDGLDEALIPYDAQRRYVKGRYEGENHLRDDELGRWIDWVRLKAGSAGSVIVVLDACHSGTGTRVEEEIYVRGTNYIFAPADYALDHKVNTGSLKLALTMDETLSPVTVLSACAANQKNYEYYDASHQVYHGSLTYALAKLLAQRQARTGTELAEALCKEMKTMFAAKRWTQTPVLESTNEENILTIGLPDDGK